jgi:coproporphyrinogen III oxidase-like Fe-S oxidoreductase
VPQRAAHAALDLLQRRRAIADGAVDGRRDARAGDRLLRAAPDLEVTLEASPTSSEAEPSGRCAQGRQPHLARRPALDDAVVRFLGREHSAAEALAAVDLAARLFARFSFDLIYGP